MSSHWLEFEKLWKLGDSDLERIKNFRDVWELHHSWLYLWNNANDRIAELQEIRQHLDKRTSELTAQIEALTEELYQEKLKHG